MLPIPSQIDECVYFNYRYSKLLKLLVLRLGFLQDGDVGVGVFPEGENAVTKNFCLTPSVE
jgi:hypothetical protein